MKTPQRSSRKSLPLSDRDLADLEVLRASAVHCAALAHLVDDNITEETSEAALLHAVHEAGMRAIRLEVEEAGYAQIAAGSSATDSVAARQAVARRRRPTWADE